MIDLVQTNIDQFNSTIEEYIKLSRRSTQEAVIKQGNKLAFALRGRLALISPKKGSITAERLSALKTGGGVYVRPLIAISVMKKYGAATRVKDRSIVFGNNKQQKSALFKIGGIKKRLNLQALMVKRELALRERGLGYLGLAARMSGISDIVPGKRARWFGRYKQEIAEAGLVATETSAGLRLQYGSEESKVGIGMKRPRAQAAIAAALREVRLDMMEYINRKNLERGQKSGLEIK
jgi:hypothetical protein